MAIDRSHLQPGMDVVGSDGAKIGRIKEVRETDLLVDRTLQRDIAVPFDAVYTVADERVMLTIPADRVDAMGWPSPEIIPPPAVRIPPLSGG